MKNLYLVTTQGLGDYHVLSNDPTEAFGKSLSDDAKPFLSDKSKRLLIVKHWA